MIAPKQKHEKPQAQKSGGKLPMCAVALGLVVAVGVATFLLMRHEEPVEQLTKETKRPARVAKPKATVPSKPTPKVEQKTQAKDPSKMYEDGVEVVKYIVSTNNSGAVTEKLTLADGRKIAKVHPPKPVFDNPADQVIALAVSAKPGESMPPLPNLNGIDEDFAKSLLSPIKINDDDPDDVKELKAKVIALPESPGQGGEGEGRFIVKSIVGLNEYHLTCAGLGEAVPCQRSGGEREKNSQNKRKNKRLFQISSSFLSGLLSHITMSLMNLGRTIGSPLNLKQSISVLAAFSAASSLAA